MTPQQEQIDFKEIIFEGSRKLGVSVSPDAVSKMLRHFHLLQQWGRQINLTSLKDPLEIALFHFLDSLTVFKVIVPGAQLRILDIGSGAGFPGLVLKIADDSLRMSLLDRNARKIVFLKKVARELRLSEITYINTALRTLVESCILPRFDVVISRAFASDPTLWDSLSVLLGPSGSLVRMAGPSSVGADFQLRNFFLSEVWEGDLPFSQSFRRVILYKKI